MNKAKKQYVPVTLLQLVEVQPELGFLVESTVDDGLRNGGIFSNYQEQGTSVDDSILDGWD